MVFLRERNRVFQQFECAPRMGANTSDISNADLKAFERCASPEENFPISHPTHHKVQINLCEQIYFSVTLYKRLVFG